MKKIITWIKPTGSWMHIWNYFWAFKPIVDISKWNETYLFIADYHSLTSVHDAETLVKNKKRMLKEYFSLLPEDSKIIVFEQSKVKNINNMNWILSSQTPYSLMLRAHTFKDSQAKNSDINMATFNYPILMSADILSYDIDLVPVWKDQKQHLEFARDIAENFNKNYWIDFFKLPDWYIPETVAIIPGIDWRKMSKSYDNHIWIFDDEKTLKKKIMSIVTWSESLEEPKNPDNCNVFAFIKLFASKEKQEEIRKKYLAWGYGYWHAKLELFDLILEYFKEAREKFEKFEKDFSLIEKKLEEWNKIANEIVDKKYAETMKIIWL